MESAIKAIIFGSNGQDGYYLRRKLEREGITHRCISRQGDAIHGDVGDFAFVKDHIRDYQPTHIFHFAAQSTAHHSALFEHHHTISGGTLNILEAVKEYCPAARIFLSGSALQFKNTGTAIDEQTPFSASSPYAVARIQSTYAARYFRSAFGLRVYVGYFFHHDSPMRPEHHMSQKIISAVKRIRAGSGEKLEIGNMDVRKEFNFAGDVIEAVWILVNQEKIFEAVIGSGKAYSIKEWVEYCFQKINRPWEEYVITKEGFVTDFNTLVSNPRQIESLGWKPKLDFYGLADVMMSNAKST